MSLNYSISNTVNYDEVGIGSVDINTTFPAIYGNLNFSYAVNFSMQTGEPITNISVISTPDYTTTTLVQPSKVNIFRDQNQTIFTGEQYNFVTFDSEYNKTFEVLVNSQVDQANTFSSVFRWDTPAQESVTGEYTFAVTYIDSETSLEATLTKSYTQELVWSQFPGLQTLAVLVSRSNK